MNLQTHVLTGILIQILCFKVFIFPLDIIFTIIFTFLSHFIIDGLVLIVYHPPEPQKGDLFWLSWQIVTYGSGAILIFIFFPYVIGIFFANFVDLFDWVILRLIHRRLIKKVKIDWKYNHFFHNIIAKIREKTLFWLPNLNYKKSAIIPEIIISFLLLIGILYLMI
ncbi:MAG: hypothetical protein ACFE91_12545 [Promethearchaeota archaeon]